MRVLALNGSKERYGIAHYAIKIVAEELLKENIIVDEVYIDDIAGGLSNAIEQSLKSERLKTELITNVSHDIKTPLTSIINYVDLLKKEIHK